MKELLQPKSEGKRVKERAITKKNLANAWYKECPHKGHAF
jgi:hypothetical protein